jgi:hypothetical protein
MKIFKKQIEYFYRNLYSTHFGYVDESLVSKGIAVEYHDHKQKKKIVVIVNPGLMLDDESTKLWNPSSDNIKYIRRKLVAFIDAYFHAECELNDFKLTRIDYAADIHVGNKVAEYIKLLCSIRQVKGFSPLKHENIAKNECFGLTGNTTGVEFFAYKSKHDKQALRAEIRLTAKTVIHAYSNAPETSKQLKEMLNHSGQILMDALQYIIPRGDHYKKKAAEKIIMEHTKSSTLRRKMLRLMDLIPTKKSLLLAQKALNIRNMYEVMAEFEHINLSPVTIGKRRDCKHLPSLYSFLD